MNVLFLGAKDSPLIAQIKSFGDAVVVCPDSLPERVQGDFAVSYGYRRILPAAWTRTWQGKAINLHISYLPWNRGADPNLWSFLEDTPKGVSIHLLDEHLDTGPLLAQKAVAHNPADTLRTSYERLQREIQSLFAGLWPSIRAGAFHAVPQTAGGTSHRASDKKAYEHLLTKGWDTPVRELIGKALPAPKAS